MSNVPSTNDRPLPSPPPQPLMASDPAGSVSRYFEQLRTGDGDAARELWKRFFPRLHGLARQTLAGYPQRIADAEDAAQSAFISFWQRAERGEFGDDLDRHNLWNLLGVITVRKALKQVKRERTQKRGGGLVRGESELADGRSSAGQDFRLDQVLAELPTHEFDLHCEELLQQLNAELRDIALFRLWGWTTLEIADHLQCTQRKVQRKMELVQLKWSQWLVE